MTSILISNDDGFDSLGIEALFEVAKHFGSPVIVAPHRERSTAGHSLTLHKPLRVHPVRENVFAVTGTPADCTYIAIREVMNPKPTLCLSGINMGANLGTDIHYSGTVAAAREAALMNIPSYAFSIVLQPTLNFQFDRNAIQFETAKAMVQKVLEKNFHVGMPNHTLLNVNIPNIPMSAIRGIRITRQGFRHYKQDVMRRQDPRGKDYYWIGGPYAGFESGTDCDCQAVEEGFVSVCPITIDATHNAYYEKLKTFQP